MNSSTPAHYKPAAPLAGYLFTSKERDSESGLDYFGARYMSSAQGVSPAQTQVPLD